VRGDEQVADQPNTPLAAVTRCVQGAALNSLKCRGLRKRPDAAYSVAGNSAVTTACR
jgi:hypothetical protein